MPKYLVKYKVVGCDHDGYCSGSDADGPDENFEHEEYDLVDKDQPEDKNYFDKNILPDQIELDQNHFVKDLEVFNYRIDGCTSGGSGYCSGFYQEYICLWALQLDPDCELLRLKSLATDKYNHIVRDYAKDAEDIRTTTLKYNTDLKNLLAKHTDELENLQKKYADDLENFNGLKITKAKESDIINYEKFLKEYTKNIDPDLLMS
jgi:hypothetical protein